MTTEAQKMQGIIAAATLHAAYECKDEPWMHRVVHLTDWAAKIVDGAEIIFVVQAAARQRPVGNRLLAGIAWVGVRIVTVHRQAIPMRPSAFQNHSRLAGGPHQLLVLWYYAVLYGELPGAR
jgi:ABC-type transport system involved in cytochrome bd biosynthesis fused ATPase/permease subunit